MATRKSGLPIKRDYFNTVLPKWDILKSMIARGHPVRDLAATLGISVNTYHKWRSRYDDLKLLHADARTQHIAELKRSLYQEAKGFEYTETQTEEITNCVTGEVTYRKVKKIKKYARSSPQLLIFALCNWDPENFKRTDTEEIIKSLQVFMSKEVENTYGD